MKHRILKSILIACGMVVMVADDAHAIPVFARKYRTSCTTCHTGFNKLNSFGEAFRQNGYNIPGGRDVALVKEEPVSLGAEAWKRVFPEAVWPGAIPSNVPVAFLVHQRMNIKENNEPTTNFNFPHEFELHTAGTLTENISFWGEVVLDEDGENKAAVERMFMRFNDLFSQDRWGGFGWLPEDALNLKVGLFDLMAAPIAEPTRRTLSRPIVYDFTIGSNPFKFSQGQAGFEASGVLFNRFGYQSAIVNGNGSVNDNNDPKDFYYRFSYKLGGMGLDGAGGASTEELAQTDNWVDNSVTLGTFGYFGSAKLSGATFKEDRFRRIGVDGRVNFRNLDLYGALMLGRDEKPSTDITIRDVDATAYFLEGDYVIKPWLIGALRYEGVKFSERLSAAKATNNAIVANLAAFARANVRFMIEAVLPLTNEDKQINSGNKKLVLDLTYLF